MSTEKTEVTFSGSANPITEDDLRRLEGETGVALPPAYRAFLLRQNGGSPVPARFDSRDGKLTSCVTRFAPVEDEGEYNLQREIEGITGYRLISSTMIPIAIDPVENRVVLAVGGRDLGRVYYWAWDEEPDPPTCSRRYMRLVADSFDEFLALLHA